MRVLVTGGAGYVGSHVVQVLLDAGHQPSVLDDLSTGHADLLPDVPLHAVCLNDTAALGGVFRNGFEAVIHCAGLISVADSFRMPLDFHRVNVTGTRNLVTACAAAGIRHLVFSSSGAVYGKPTQTPVSETASCEPLSPYGTTKLMGERLLGDAAAAGQLSFVALRYFNVAGADLLGRRGECRSTETHLLPLALQVASGRRQELVIYGDDYPTADGTCVRDYVHVCDLADAHVLALDYLAAGGASVTLNCGYGRGYSVKEVVAAVRRMTGSALPCRRAERRNGDPAVLVADGREIRRRLGWQPAWDNLDSIVASG